MIYETTVTGQVIGGSHHDAGVIHRPFEGLFVVRVRDHQHRAGSRLGEDVQMPAQAVRPLPGRTVQVAVGDQDVRPFPIDQGQQLFDRAALFAGNLEPPGLITEHGQEAPDALANDTGFRLIPVRDHGDLLEAPPFVPVSCLRGGLEQALELVDVGQVALLGGSVFEPSTARADASIAIAPALDNMLGGVRSANFSPPRWINWPTNVLFYTKTGGMTLATIADEFGLSSYASAGATIRNIRRRMEEHRGLRRDLKYVLQDLTP